MKNFSILGAAGAVLIVLAGCGSSYSSSTAASSATATTAAAAAASAAGPGARILTKDSKLGTELAAGPKRLTVYLFEADKDGRSVCSGSCAQVWPPVTTGAAARVSGAAQAADLGTIRRSDGTMQVTYKGHPLYTYVKDKDDGDAYGEGISSFGAAWYALTPSGRKIDEGHGGDGS